MVDLVKMLEKQLELQTTRMGGDPAELSGDERANFIVWNTTACVDELHEAMNETGWKPWATSRHVNQPQFNKEMVDAFHFFMNLLLVTNPNKTPTEVGEEFEAAYYYKNGVNAQRQIDGYDGVSTKCPNCKRELTETNSLNHRTVRMGPRQGQTFCSNRCLLEGDI